MYAVSIFVLVEVSFRHKLLKRQIEGTRVSIFVLVEVSFRLQTQCGRLSLGGHVSIFVLVEVSFRHEVPNSEGYGVSSFNLCFSRSFIQTEA